MNRRETLDFARALMNQVWLPLDPEPVPRFYHRDVVGWNRRQRLTFVTSRSPTQT